MPRTVVARLVLVLLNGAAGVGGMGYGYVAWQKARRSRRWPSVAGKVLRTFITCSTTARGGTQYYGQVLYEYSVGGRVFQSDCRQFGGSSPQSEEGAELLCSRYNVGDTVWVFYNPTEPSEAALEHSTSVAWHWLLLGAFFAGMAVWECLE